MFTTAVSSVDQGLACGEQKTELVSKLVSFSPQLHPDNTRQAYLTCMELNCLSIKGQMLGLRSCLSHLDDGGDDALSIQTEA